MALLTPSATVGLETLLAGEGEREEEDPFPLPSQAQIWATPLAMTLECAVVPSLPGLRCLWRKIKVGGIVPQNTEERKWLAGSTTSPKRETTLV